MQTSYGFRIVGGISETRRLVQAAAALVGYCSCDPRAEIGREAYLSAFQFDQSMRQRADAYNRLDVRGYSGVCGAAWIWFDIDREGNLEAALKDVRRLAGFVLDRYRLNESDLWPFYSGSKGFHLGLPTALFNPEPSPAFPAIVRRFCEEIAATANVTIDSGVYDRVRAFRAPNSRHPKTGLHKRMFSLDEFMGLRIEAILAAARQPLETEVPAGATLNVQAVLDWQAACEAVSERSVAMKERKASGTAKLNRATLEFIRNGAAAGDRHRLLFSAAANLAELACSFELAWELLSEAALDSGLPPKEVRRQIECGLKSGHHAPP